MYLNKFTEYHKIEVIKIDVMLNFGINLLNLFMISKRLNTKKIKNY